MPLVACEGKATAGVVASSQYGCGKQGQVRPLLDVATGVPTTQSLFGTTVVTK